MRLALEGFQDVIQFADGDLANIDVIAWVLRIS